MSPDPTAPRAIRIVSQCATKDDFIAVFHPYLERDSLFVATASPEEAGAKLRFVMTLAGGEAVLRGAGVVVESHRSKSNFYGRRGMKLRFDELDLESQSALRAVEAGPRRHTSSPPPAGRGPNEMVECLIYEDPGTDSREPLGDPGEGETSEPGNLMPLTADDDVTAVAPPPRRQGDSGDGDKSASKPGAPSAAGPGPNGPHGRGPGFVVPRPRSDPSVATRPAGGGRLEMAQPDTDQMTELPPSEVEQAAVADAKRRSAARAVPEPVPAPPRLPPPEEVSARARRGKGTGPTATAETPPSPQQAPQPVAAAPGASNPMADIAALNTMRLPAVEARRAGPMPPDRFRPDSSPPEYAGGDFTPPPGMTAPVDPLGITGPLPPLVRQPNAPRRPLIPAETITPTEIVSPLALENRTERRRGRGPMVSERTDVVRVSYVRTAAVSATLGALLGLAAGYMLWGLEQEQPATIGPEDEVSASPDPEGAAEAAAVQPRPVAEAADAGADTAGAGASPADAAPARPSATPKPTPAKKPPPPRRRRR